MPFTSAHPSLLRALAERGYTEPTAVQAAVLGEGAAGRDLLVSAQTGSGKTVAFGLALAPELLGDRERFAPAEAPLALVVAPTRELALQVERELAWLYAPAGARLAACVGGMDIRREQRSLAQGAHLVVGTPGRLRDHLERGNLDVSALRAVVLDEADEMLDMGFREDLEFILDATPAERRTLLFSATIPKEIAGLAKRYQKDALRVATAGEREAHRDIEYRVLRIAPGESEHAVVNLLRWFEAPGAIVFCSTREAVRHLQASLVERGFSAVALSGELTQNERNHALQALRDGRARVCVATDVAARGLDLPDLGLVVHADLPHDREALLHRSGRTGRAGRKGVSVLIVPYTRRRRAEQLLAAANLRAAWSAPPSAEEIRAKDRERLLRELVPAADLPAEEREAARCRRSRAAATVSGSRLASSARARGAAGAVAGTCTTAPARACGERRRRGGLVPHERRARPQRRPALADPADLPPRPRDQARDRLDPDLRARDALRDRAARRRALRRGRRTARSAGPIGAHRATARRAAGAARTAIEAGRARSLTPGHCRPAAR